MTEPTADPHDPSGGTEPRATEHPTGETQAAENVAHEPAG